MRPPSFYIDAARRITPSQFLGRIRRAAIPISVLAARPGPRPGWNPVGAGVGEAGVSQSGPEPPPHLDGVFRALGVERAAGAPGFWHDSSDGLLFLFHLHGFERLPEYAGGETTPHGDRFWAETLRSWLDQCDRPSAPEWHPYPTSTRVIAWGCALSADLKLPTQLEARAKDSLWRQARYLGRAIERDIGGNHVIRNAVALVVCGAVCESTRLRDRGLRLLEAEMGSQLLSDGGHEERSTAYHQLVAADLRDALSVGERVGLELDWLQQGLGRMDEWSRQVVGPDGKLPLLNDSWEWPVAGPRATAEVTELSETGLQILRDGDDQLIFDVGPLSPDHLPPHGHADTLSVIAWVDGRPLLVDPGAYAYTGPVRDEFRGTAAHNTVEVDGMNQCEYWGDFRFAFPPEASAERPRRVGPLTVLRGHHLGYERLANPVIHERTVAWWPRRATVIVDRLLGEGRHRVRSRLHLAPGITRGSEDRAGPVRIRPLEGECRVERASYSPYLGVEEEIEVLEQALEIQPGARVGWGVLREGVEISMRPAEVVLTDEAGATARLPLD